MTVKKTKDLHEHQNILGDHLVSEMINVSIKNDTAPSSKCGFISQKRPLVEVADLTTFVLHLLDQYSETGKLIDTPGIPADEIWIKIGGDHGGENFKMCMQVLNVDAPNSRENVIAISYALMAGTIMTI